VLVGGDVGGYVKGAVNLPLSDKAALRVVGYDTEYGGFVDALGEGGTRKKNVNDGYRARRPGVAAVPADREHQHHPARGLSGDPRRRLQSPGGVQPVRQPQHHHPAPRSPWASASSTCCWTRASPTRPSWAT
jgi:hypothetical protein